MRNVYLVCYDVADEKRLRKAYKKMCGFGDPLQYSVFRCELSPTERQLLKEALWAILNWNQDRVLLVHLGPAGSRANQRLEFWGDPRTQTLNRAATIV